MTNKHMNKCLLLLVIRKTANQNHSEIPLHTHQDGYNKNKQGIISVDKNVEKLESSYVASENIKMLQPPWKTVWHFLKNLKVGLSHNTGFPCGSAGKESACNVRDLSLIPGLGRSPGEGKGYTHSSILAWRIPRTV